MRKTIDGTVILATALAAAALWVSPAAAQSPGFVTRVSTSSAGVEGDNNSGRVAMSSDGRFVAFDSSATNLVPGDTNDNSDVFVHDVVTGVVSRVSVTWNGMEARDDSLCPALSADGRYVAFLSRAWNMYPGGANLGSPRAEIFLHDRQTGLTTRITRTLDGSVPDEDSSCPGISADGSRIVFASLASNLVRRDGNGDWDVFLYDASKQKIKLVSRTADDSTANQRSERPAISADGGTVVFASQATNLDGVPLPEPASPFGRIQRAFARDWATGTIEMIDVTPLQPSELSNGSVYSVAVSGDGRRVAFSSEATNLVNQPLPITYSANIYLRDRDAQTTVLVSPEELAVGCQIGTSARCNPGLSYLPAISADGRWVSFTSYSQRLLPMSFYGTPQVYVFDSLGRRLRRVSVGPQGFEAGCTGESALSRDGSVLALSSDWGILVQANGHRDVYRHELLRTADGRRRAQAACPLRPTTCSAATSALFRLRKHPPGGIDPDRLFWRFEGPPGAPLPDPTADARYQLCIYGGSGGVVAMDVGTAATAACPAGDAPCWQLRGNQQKLHDRDGALQTLTVYGGPSATRILARGTGPLLDAPYLPVITANGLTVQLQDATSGRCWSADFPATAVKKNFAGTPGGTGRDDGWLVAELR